MHLKTMIMSIFSVLILLSGCQEQLDFKIVKEAIQFVNINGKTVPLVK